jgi:microsomal dipeptidase-like Zn-dependent dipeptidase
VADLQALAPLLRERGYTETDIENILGKNWLNRLEGELPA